MATNRWFANAPFACRSTVRTRAQNRTRHLQHEEGLHESERALVILRQRHAHRGAAIEAEDIALDRLVVNL